MDTKIIKIYPAGSGAEAIAEAADVLRRGGLVAFPTETVYGLGADAFNADAVKKVFKAKGRPPDNPLIVHVAEVDHLDELAETVPSKAKILAEKFWPGPLTLVVRNRGEVPDVVTAGLETVAIRMPNHPVALKLIGAVGRGIVGPSANFSGGLSPTRAEHVRADLDGKIDMILDSGLTKIGVESTVVDVTIDPPLILRHGGLVREDIEKVIGELRTTSSDLFLRRSPGTRHRHYAPQAQVILVEQKDARHFDESVKLCQFEGKKVGAIVHSHQLKEIGSQISIVALSGDLHDFSRDLFDALRRLDEEGVDVTIVESVPENGLGAAVMERLRRAADQVVTSG